MEARNEITEDLGEGTVDGYEQLRQRALSGDVDGWRRAWVCCSTAESPLGWGVRTAMAPVRPTPTRPSPPATAGGVATELVGLLASMALAVAARG